MTLAKKADPQTGEIVPILGDPREIQEVLADNLAGDEISPFDLDRVGIPMGGATAWTVPALGGDEMAKEIQGVIISHRIVRAYWSKTYAASGGGASPDCESPNIMSGQGIGDPGGECDTCPLNQWGTAVDDKGEATSGKACKQTHLLFVMRPDELLPLVVVASPGSLAPLRKYFTQLSSRRTNHRHVVTGLGLERTSSKTGLAYSRVLPRLVAVLDEESKKRADQVCEALAPLLGAVELRRDDLYGGPGDVVSAARAAGHHVIDDAEGEAREVDPATGEIRDPRLSDTEEIFPPDEGEDAPLVNLPASCSSMVLLQQLWGKMGWGRERVEEEVLDGQTTADFLATGDNTKGKMTNALYIKWRQKVGV